MRVRLLGMQLNLVVLTQLSVMQILVQIVQLFRVHVLFRLVVHVIIQQTISHLINRYEIVDDCQGEFYENFN